MIRTWGWVGDSQWQSRIPSGLSGYMLQCFCTEVNKRLNKTYIWSSILFETPWWFVWWFFCLLSMLICSFVAKALSSQTNFKNQLCQVCAEICRVCSVECMKHAHTYQHCLRCALACESCAIACDKVLEVYWFVSDEFLNKRAIRDKKL